MENSNQKRMLALIVSIVALVSFFLVPVVANVQVLGFILSCIWFVCCILGICITGIGLYKSMTKKLIGWGWNCAKWAYRLIPYFPADIFVALFIGGGAIYIACIAVLLVFGLPIIPVGLAIRNGEL